MKKSGKCSVVSGSVSAPLKLALAVLAVAIACGAQQSQPLLQITSPTAGTIVSPGQTVTVVVTLAPGYSSSIVGINDVQPLDRDAGLLTSDQNLGAPPYQFTITIPKGLRAGKHWLVADGVIGPGQWGRSPLFSLDVEPPSSVSVSSIRVLPAHVTLARPGSRLPLTVTGAFSDGSTMDLTNSTGTTYTPDDPTVAKVSSGFVFALGAGYTGIVIQYGGQSATVPVRVLHPAASMTAAKLSPAANSAGWNDSDVTVTLTAQVLGASMSGVKQITYRATGAQAIASTIVAGSTASFVINIEGTTTVSYFSTDNAGNVENTKTLTVRLDKTPPSVNCAAPDTQWHANDVMIACTASDSGSGLANPADASFSLSTSVPAGTETADASTNSQLVCDVAGNCGTAGPITGIMVDKKPPAITITTPAPGAPIFALNQALAANYSCTDGGSGVATCSGPVASGANLDTGSVGTKPFTVNATDKVGNSSSASAPYVVAYNICPLYDQTTAVQSGAVVPIKLELCDASGNDVSASVVTVHATGVVQLSTNAPGTLQSVGNANPDSDFRFDSALGASGGYIFNLSTQGYATGTYGLSFTATGDPTQHSVQFQVRQ